MGQNLVASSGVRVMFWATISLRCCRRFARSISMSWSEAEFGWSVAVVCDAGFCAAWPNTDALHMNIKQTTTKTYMTFLFIVLLLRFFVSYRDEVAPGRAKDRLPVTLVPRRYRQYFPGRFSYSLRRGLAANRKLVRARFAGWTDSRLQYRRRVLLSPA